MAGDGVLWVVVCRDLSCRTIEKQYRHQVRSWCCASRTVFPCGPQQTFNDQVFRLGVRIEEGQADDLRTYAVLLWRSQLGGLDDVVMGVDDVRLIDVAGVRTSDTVCEAGDGPRLQMTAVVFVVRTRVERICLRGKGCAERRNQAFQAYYFRSESRRWTKTAGLPSFHDECSPLRLLSSLTSNNQKPHCSCSKQSPRTRPCV